MKKFTIIQVFSISIILALASCTGSRNFSFKDAYKFKTIQYARQQSAVQAPEQAEPAPVSVEASVESTQPQMDLARKIKQTEQNLLKQLNIAETEAHALTKEELEEKVQGLSRKDKRTIRKELKNDIREIKKMAAKVEDVRAVTELQSTAAVEGMLRTGIIVGGAGLLLMIIAGVAGLAGPILWILGVLAFITGLVLILIDVL